MSEKQSRKAIEKQKKIDNYVFIKKKLTKQGYTESEGTISVLKANARAFVTAGPFFILVVAIYLAIHGEI